MSTACNFSCVDGPIPILFLLDVFLISISSFHWEERQGSHRTHMSKQSPCSGNKSCDPFVHLILSHSFDWTILINFFWFLGLHLQRMEIPRLGVKSELQLWAYATTMQNLSLFCELHHSSQQHPILNPLSEVRD